jgi:diguanylate cyclase (GGDEF)-like protein
LTATIAAFTALLTQQGLFALLWAAIAWLGLAPRAAWQWSGGTVCIALGLWLVVMRDSVSVWLGFWLSGTAIYIGFVVLCRGIESFVGKSHADRWQWAGVAAFGAVLAVCIHLNKPWAVITVANLPLGLVLLRAGVLAQRGLQWEFGRRAATLCALPFASGGALLLLRGISAPWLPAVTGSSVHGQAPANVGLALAFVALGLLLNFGLVALVIVRMMRELQRASQHDQLTGLLNRRGVESRLQAETARLHRHGVPFAVLSIDVDHFKRINDQHGHPAGDAVLQALARIFVKSGRGVDVAARAGGEEFWIVMPGTGLDGARVAADRVLTEVRALRVPWAGRQIAATVSIGVAQTVSPDETAEQLMHRLDAALYRAKQGGRDRVEVSERPGETLLATTVAA